MVHEMVHEVLSVSFHILPLIKKKDEKQIFFI